jgi:hypothetical protein
MAALRDDGVKADHFMLLMKHQLFLAHFYYHHNPPRILSSTSANAAIRDVWEAIMPGELGSSYPEQGTANETKLAREVRVSATLQAHPLPPFLAG